MEEQNHANKSGSKSYQPTPEQISLIQEQISLVLPTTESVPQALSQYQAIAQASGLSIQSVGINSLAIKPAVSDTGLAKS